MFTPSSTSLPDRFCGSREILSSVCPTRNGGLFLSTFRLQINKHSDSASPLQRGAVHSVIYCDLRGIFHGRLETTAQKQDKLN
jgi:hypothetical protein